MKNVYIDSSESLWLDKIFNKDLVTIDELLDKLEDLIIENDELKEELDDLKRDVEENYKRVNPYE